MPNRYVKHLILASLLILGMGGGCFGGCGGCGCGGGLIGKKLGESFESLEQAAEAQRRARGDAGPAEAPPEDQAPAQVRSRHAGLSSYLAQADLKRLSAKVLKKRMTKLGYKLKGCAESEVETGRRSELSCTFSGKGQHISLTLIAFDDRDEMDEACFEMLPSGRLLVSGEESLLSILLRESSGKPSKKEARTFAKKLFPKFVPGAERFLVLVSMEDSKPDGRDWDALGGAPDPYIVVDGESYRNERCQDDYDCSFIVPAAKRMEIKVVDADGADDDPAGKAMCRPGPPCLTESASLQLIPIW